MQEIVTGIISIGDVVENNFNETGIVVDVINYVWFTKYYVEITEPGLFNELGDVVDYLQTQIYKQK